MARDFVRASSHYMQVTGLLGTPSAVSFSAWVDLDSADTEGGGVISLGDYCGILARVNWDGSGQIGGWYYSGGNWYERRGASIQGAGWTHVAYGFANGSQRLFRAGTLAASSTESRNITWTGLGANTQIARHGDGSTDWDFDGRLAEIGVWNVQLTDNEFIALSRGVSPRFIRPSNLILYLPLHGIESTEPDLSGNAYNGTVSGATQANHAPVEPLAIWIPSTGEIAGGGAYELTANAGNYAVTGNTTGITAQRALSLEAGSYTVTGNTVDLLIARFMAAAAGTYTVTGRDATLAAARLLGLNAGAYTVTGNDTALTRGYGLTLGTDSYAVTGNAASLLTTRLLEAGAGMYTLTGQDLALTASRLLSLNAGSYAVTGQDVALTVARQLALAAGAYTLTGQDVTLAYVPNSGAYELVAEAGAYTVTGQDVSLLVSRALTASAGSYTVTGNDASLLLGHLLTAAQGSYTVTGQDATLAIARALSLATGSYAVTGKTVTLLYTGATTQTDADRIYVIAAEDRIYVIAAESRTATIPAENRTLIIQ